LSTENFPDADRHVAIVDSAITSRMSTRAFTRQAVPQQMLQDILQVASRAPSGTNCQPWKVYVLQGQSRDSLVDKVCAAHDALRADPALAAEYREEYDYYPEKWSASARVTRTRCTRSTNVTTGFLTRRSA